MATAVTVTGTFTPGETASLAWQLSGDLFDSAGHLVHDTAPVPVTLANGSFASPLVAVDDSTSQPTGLVWTLAGMVDGRPFAESFQISHTMAPTVDISTLTPAEVDESFHQYALATALTTETVRAVAAEAQLAPLASPALTGTPTAPTPATTDNSTTLATTAFVQAQAGSSAKYYPLTVEVGAQEVYAGPCTLFGWLVNETTGTWDAELDIWDGQPGSGGTFVGTVNFGANESDCQWLEQGVAITVALWVDNSFGAPAGNVGGSMFVVHP